MITELLEYLNNWFIDTHESGKFEFKASLDATPIYTIEAPFYQDYLVGQYISVDGSKLNDGVYKVTAVESGKITVDTQVLTETASISLWGLAVPKQVVSLAGEIAEYKASNLEGIASETQGSRSIAYKNGSGWEDVYKQRLIPYRRLYSDKMSRSLRYGMVNR